MLYWARSFNSTITIVRSKSGLIHIISYIEYMKCARTYIAFTNNVSIFELLKQLICKLRSYTFKRMKNKMKTDSVVVLIFRIDFNTCLKSFSSDFYIYYHSLRNRFDSQHNVYLSPKEYHQLIMNWNMIFAFHEYNEATTIHVSYAHISNAVTHVHYKHSDNQ